MPTVRKVLQDTLDTVRNTDNRMDNVETNFYGIGGIGDTVNSIYEQLPTLATGDLINASVASVQSDYQQLIGGVSTQVTTTEIKVDTVTAQVTNIESVLIPTLATLTYQDILHQAEVALITGSQASIDSIINTQLPNFEAGQVTLIGGVATQVTAAQASLDAIAQTQLPNFEAGQVTLIGGVATQVTAAQASLDAIAQTQLPNFEAGQVTLIGGVATQVTAAQASLDAIAQTQLPNLETSLATQLTNAESVLSTQIGVLPTQTYSTELSALQTTVDSVALNLSGVPTIEYSDRFNSVQATLDLIVANQGGSSSNIPDYTNQLNNIQSKVDTIPTYNPNSGIAQLIGGQANQATSSQANLIKTDTQFIKDSLPNLATSSQSKAITDSLNSLSSSVANIPKDTYGTRLQTLQDTVNSTRDNVQAIPKNTYNDSFNQQAILVGGARSDTINVGNKVDLISQQLPNLAKGSDLANANAKLDNQAILVGGIRTQQNAVQNDTQAIRTELPRLATGNQSESINSAISSLNGSVSSLPKATYNGQLDKIESSVSTGRNEGNGIPRNVYNSQLNALQSSINAIPNYNTQIANAATQSAGANASIATVRSEQSNRFNSVDNSLTIIDTKITNAFGSNGTASSVVSVNATQLIAPYVATIPERDLVYLLGVTESGYLAVGNVVIGITTNSTENGDPNSIFGRDTNSGYYSTNASGRFLTLDLGLNKVTRNIVLNGLGFKSYNFGNGYPVSLTISGSNNNSSYTPINTWSSIGFSLDLQWKYATFSNTTAYRYLRFTQSGLNSSGNNYFGLRELRLYGTINNP